MSHSATTSTYISFDNAAERINNKKYVNDTYIFY